MDVKFVVFLRTQCLVEVVNSSYELEILKKDVQALTNNFNTLQNNYTN